MEMELFLERNKYVLIDDKFVGTPEDHRAISAYQSMEQLIPQLKQYNVKVTIFIDRLTAEVKIDNEEELPNDLVRNVISAIFI